MVPGKDEQRSNTSEHIDFEFADNTYSRLSSRPRAQRAKSADHESEFLLTDEEAQRVPELTKFLAAALRHPYFDGDVDRRDVDHHIMLLKKRT